MALLEIMSMVSHTHWENVWLKHQRCLKIHCRCYTALEIEGFKADIEVCIWHATCESVATNSKASMSKKKILQVRPKNTFRNRFRCVKGKLGINSKLSWQNFYSFLISWVTSRNWIVRKWRELFDQILFFQINDKK